MIDSLKIFVSDYPWVLVLVSAVSLMGMLYLRQQMQSLAAAEELVRKQYDPLPADLIDGLIDFAEHQGRRDGVLTLLRLIRTEYGRDGVRYGHVYWIMDLLDKDFDPDNIMNIPSFRREDATKS